MNNVIHLDMQRRLESTTRLLKKELCKRHALWCVVIRPNSDISTIDRVKKEAELCTCLSLEAGA